MRDVALVSFAASTTPRSDLDDVEMLAPVIHEAIESSGLARWGNHLLTHPDSAAQAELYEIDDEGEFFRTIPISGATNTDWEDLAVAACDEGECAFIGDIGDNEDPSVAGDVEYL